jgi:hypothetical protein
VLFFRPSPAWVAVKKQVFAGNLPKFENPDQSFNQRSLEAEMHTSANEGRSSELKSVGASTTTL